tara:strand:- start:539 stop:1183 length:645 start_codon:yes stop_codon:yes gene_type:complete
MDEDLAIINTNTRNEKIKKFFLDNKKKLVLFVVLIIALLILFFSFNEYKKIQKKKISNYYNSTVIKYTESSRDQTTKVLIDIVNQKDSTYSPLSLYFILDNKLITDKDKINELFDILIEKTAIKDEIKNLIIYKKALFNADKSDENQLLTILNPIINSESIWKSHSLYLMAEFFYYKNEKQKSKEFFTQILSIDNANKDILKKSQIRLNRDFSD